MALPGWLAPSSLGAFPGANGKIAFERADGSGIVVMEPDGDGQTSVAQGADPAWSADGQKIAFATGGAGNLDIFVMNANGSGQTNLTNTPEADGVEFDPTWSPDGQKIAFAKFPDEDSAGHGDGAQIWVMNANGSGQTQLTSGAIGDEGDEGDEEPVWSPDGLKIAFTSEAVPGPEGVRNRDIFVMNSDGSGQTNITNTAGAATQPEEFEEDPNWSPDGQKIAFDAFGQIFVMNANGSGRSTLSSSGAFDPAWSPDGQKIVFESDRSPHLGNHEIYVMNADGSGQTRVTNNAAHDFAPDWQPLGCPGAESTAALAAPRLSGGAGPTSAEPFNPSLAFEPFRAQRDERATRALERSSRRLRRAARGDVARRPRPLVPARMVRRAASGAVIEPAATAAPKVSRVVPAAAVPGAAVLVKGSGLRGKGTRVTVGGKRAKVLSARSKELRIAVPRAKAGPRQLVVKRGRRASGKRFRVLKPFKGTIGAKPDTKRAKSAAIGPAGGELTASGADRTRYTLRVPAGALAQEERITLTPVARFSGLPFTGGRVAGVDLAPDGLRFAIPATLEIEPKQRFPSSTVGFSYAAGGTGLELQAPTRTGRVLSLRIDHFSGASATTAAEADFARIVGPILAGGATLSESQIRSIIGQIAVFSQTFDRPAPPHPPPGHFFCQSEPTCGQAIQRGLDSLTVLVDQQCEAGRANPEIERVVALIELEGMRATLGAQDDASFACREQIMASLLGLATFAARSDPYGVSPFAGGPAAAQGNLDGDGQITNFEWLLGLALNAGASGFSDLSATGVADALALMAELPARGRARCQSDRTGGEADLALGQTYANVIDPAFSLGQAVLDAFVEALDFCRLEVQVSPAQVTLARQATQQFTANVTGLLNPPTHGEVSWTASGGTIDANGVYTAPDANGTFEVRATSTTNPARVGVATVSVEGCPAS
jgi:Tol biopolymer transport system component